MLKILTKGCEPTKGSKYSACIDLRTNNDYIIPAGETKLIGLGICIDPEKLENTILTTLSQEQDKKEHIGNWNLSQEQDKKEYIDNWNKTHYLQLAIRSSLGKKGLILPNGIGIIDMDYRDEIKMIVYNSNKQDFNINKNDRVGQMMICRHETDLFNIDTEETRKGGFGSSGER